MSTFNGYVSEFPHIRIDHFRPLPNVPKPLATFLSHVHSDHLCGLESFRSTFIYCSAATRSILMRLEKFPHRINYAKGILEARVQTYKSLDRLLKPIPLETPTRIELSPDKEIQVTLFEANHCVGAVSLLIQGNGSSFFYTGDVRAEPWWIEALVRHPMMLPYARGLKRLDRLYLDTTFATKEQPYRDFPSKADGITELLRKIEACDADTKFYFHAWTFGYEDVFLALSQVLNSPIHLDRYRYSLYTSVGNADKTTSRQQTREGPAFGGFLLANTHHPGIFTRDPTKSRIHSCEKGSDCPIFNDADDVVQITPIVSRYNGQDMHELGAGGGKGDLDQMHELELGNAEEVMRLIALVKGKTAENTEALHSLDRVLEAVRRGERQRVELALPGHITAQLETSHLTLSQLTDLLSEPPSETLPKTHANSRGSPKSIQFPYSRHSSHSELAHLIRALNPADIYPCTAPSVEDWTEATSMKSLFGHVCPDGVFAWDATMRAEKAKLDISTRAPRTGQDSQHATQSTDATESPRQSQNGKGGGLFYEREDEETGAVAAPTGQNNEEVGTRGASVITIDSDSSDFPSEANQDRMQSSARAVDPEEKKASKLPVITPPRPVKGLDRKRKTSLANPTQRCHRLRARNEAFEAVRLGRWGSARLTCTRGEEDSDWEL